MMVDGVDDHITMAKDSIDQQSPCGIQNITQHVCMDEWLLKDAQDNYGMDNIKDNVLDCIYRQERLCVCEV